MARKETNLIVYIACFFRTILGTPVLVWSVCEPQSKLAEISIAFAKDGRLGLFLVLKSFFVRRGARGGAARNVSWKKSKPKL